MKKKLTLIDSTELPRIRDGSDFVYKFELVDISFIGTPEERYYTTQHAIKVGISGTMEAAWLARQPRIDFKKVCFEFGIRELAQKVKDGTILEYQELQITSVNFPSTCPFQSDKIRFFNGTSIEFMVGEKIMEDISLLQIASSIIDYRDFINAIVKERYGHKLFLLAEERDLLQLFRSAGSIEEFVFRISALKSFATNLNEILLREQTGNNEKNVKSITLLELFLKKHSNYDIKAIETLKRINRLRQMYPIHGDNVDGVLDSHRFFGIEYPIIYPLEAWRKILSFYNDSLNRILQILKK